ncbi:aspartate aminotransferase family protein [Salinibacillus xinjiangensis]|uniref:aspartate aminotransferase family protein n=1 Tax=Salinibacillus xinjiangensis TaxID=1229268 RepID=UPI001E6039F6|nr:aspartate aminotransferase family protein [Salinibacillus xinjiangensis]
MLSEEASLLSDPNRKSRELYERACEVMPGGVTANIKYFEPHPIMMEKGKGSKLFDVDGNEYIDYLLCYGALIHGHGNEPVMKAVYDQLANQGTTIFGTPHDLEVKMAEKLIELYPGIDMVRYTNSGLEATLLAVRTAMAYTEKDKIAKFEGHYHGGSNQFLLSVNPDIEKSGTEDEPVAVPESTGISSHEVEHTIILPFNNMDATERILRKQADELAAIILEPVQGGFIPADEEFIIGLRKLTNELGILLIFDEVKTGFRTSLGGCQEIFGVKPDLTALGKVLGGGFPVGAVGGRKDIMMISAPNGGRDILSAGEHSAGKKEILFHSGTYNGHPTVLAAGLATIQALEESNQMQKLCDRTKLLRQKLEEVYQRQGVDMQTIGMGSIFNIVLTKETVKNYRDLQKANMSLRKVIDHELLLQGIYTKPLNRYSMSTAHTEEDIAKTVEIHEKALKKIRG